MELVKASGKIVAEVARDLRINDTTLGNWAKADRAERGVPDETCLLPLTVAELTRLRRGGQDAQDRAGDLEEGGGLLREGVAESTRFAFIDSKRTHITASRYASPDIVLETGLAYAYRA